MRRGYRDLGMQLLYMIELINVDAYWFPSLIPYPQKINKTEELTTLPDYYASSQSAIYLPLWFILLITVGMLLACVFILLYL